MHFSPHFLLFRQLCCMLHIESELPLPHFHRLMHTVISRSFCLRHPLRIMFENSQQQFLYFSSYNFWTHGKGREKEKSEVSCSCNCCCCCYLLSCLVASSFPSSFLLCFVSGFFFFFIFTPSCGVLEALFHLSSELFFGRTQAALQFALHLKSRHSRLQRDASDANDATLCPMASWP